MVVRCVFGCALPQVLFSIPKLPTLRSRWLEFLHFEEGGINEFSRVCARHFTKDCFTNLRQYEMRSASCLDLTDTAVPSLYTVGVSINVKPLTRDVACQCSATSVRSTGAQAAIPRPKPKQRSKAIQVKLFGSSVSCSTRDFGSIFNAPFLTSAPTKRPRLEDSTDEINNTSLSTLRESTTCDSTYESHGLPNAPQCTMSLDDNMVVDIVQTEPNNVI
ncbi:hypothetical protein E1301_Tti012718 [Triplophysa tibetana]|uniref:THAP-type domain-containing protein n=1 Tax=Triplophysa tibetana TaxID=1572043 RepID=A0A5A9NUJ3_9TELE|nr:hypothetical protein E1301_Tti012718 [Triplophysa tibetana]